MGQFIAGLAAKVLLANPLGALTEQITARAASSAAAMWLATLAVGCRRLHGTGKSGWLQLLLLIPCIGAIILIVFWVQPSTPGDNAYGPVPA